MEGVSPRWILVSLWGLFEAFLFPVVFLILFTFQKLKEKRKKKPRKLKIHFVNKKAQTQCLRIEITLCIVQISISVSPRSFWTVTTAMERKMDSDMFWFTYHTRSKKLGPYFGPLF